jgi:hypothetical protein
MLLDPADGNCPYLKQGLELLSSPWMTQVSKASAEFFLDWVRERTKRVKLADASEREDVLRHHHRAEEFWRELAEKANAK